MTKPKPCPFCGKMPAVWENDDGWRVRCEEVDCLNVETPVQETRELAVAVWNTRYERTCHMVEQPDGFGSYDDVCSECGAFDSGTPYCWNCGAKVVDE